MADVIIYYGGDRTVTSYPENNLAAPAVLITYADIIDPRLGTTRTRFNRLKEARRGPRTLPETAPDETQGRAGAG